MLKRTAGRMVLYGLGGAFIGGLAGSVPALEKLLNQRIEVNISDASLPEALAAASQAPGVRFLMEVPPEPPRLTLKKGPRTVGEVLDEIATQTDAKRVDQGGIVVLQPDFYPPSSEPEKAYHQAMEGLAEFLEGLSPAFREAVADEEWLDFQALPAEEQKRVREALPDNAHSEEIWDQWSQQRTAVGFLFDPYIEIEGGKEQPRRRFFIRAGRRFLEFDRLVPGQRPGTLRAGFEGGGDCDEDSAA